MTYTTPGTHGLGDQPHPTVRLRDALQARAARVEDEITLIEGQFTQLRTRIDESRRRRDSSSEAWQRMLASLGEFDSQQIGAAFDEYSAAVVQTVLAEQHLEELADRRAEAEERYQAVQADLELLTEAAREASNAVRSDRSDADRGVSRQIFQVIEGERMRIARDMHDGPAQSMSNLVLEAEILERLVGRPEAMLAELQEFKDSVRNLLDQTRQLIFDLRPMTLDDLGLMPTLRKFAREYTEKNGIQVRISGADEEQRLPGNIEGTLFRIIQEALTNVQKHSQAKSVEVNLELSPDGVVATVRDDGQGFDVPTVEARLAQNRNLGLIIMRERCDLEHGVLEIKSHPGKGTEIRAELPLE